MTNLFEKSGKNFTIVGYSFGSLLALELTNKLESAKIKGQLILIDGAPDYLKHPDFQQFLLTNDEHLIDAFSLLIYAIYPGKNINLKSSIHGVPTMEKKFENVLELFKDPNDHQSLERLRNMIKGISERLKIMREYDDRRLQKIESRILLIRSEDSKKMDIDESYGLNRYARQQVAVKTIKGNHFQILENPELVHIINGILD